MKKTRIPGEDRFYHDNFSLPEGQDAWSQSTKNLRLQSQLFSSVAPFVGDENWKRSKKISTKQITRANPVDGSEIPFPTTDWMVLKKPVVNNGRFQLPFPQLMIVGFLNPLVPALPAPNPTHLCSKRHLCQGCQDELHP